MREIKFRALVQYSGKEPYWEYYEPLVIPYAFTDQGEGFCKVIVKNLEYTGLKDKNGKEIYEGDIIALKSYGLLAKSFAVEWGNQEFEDTGGCVGFNVNPEYDYKVIGNIYENPELLKQHVVKQAKDDVPVEISLLNEQVV